MVPKGLFDPSRRRRSRFVNDVTLNSTRVHGKVSADGIGDVHRCLQVGVTHADVAIGDERLYPVASRCTNRKQIHMNDVLSEPRAKVFQAFDVLYAALSLRALEDVHGVVLSLSVL